MTIKNTSFGEKLTGKQIFKKNGQMTGYKDKTVKG